MPLTSPIFEPLSLRAADDLAAFRPEALNVALMNSRDIERKRGGIEESAVDIVGTEDRYSLHRITARNGLHGRCEFLHGAEQRLHRLPLVLAGNEQESLRSTQSRIGEFRRWSGEEAVPDLCQCSNCSWPVGFRVGGD
jgi:hypothetical protein